MVKLTKVIINYTNWTDWTQNNNINRMYQKYYRTFVLCFKIHFQHFILVLNEAIEVDPNNDENDVGDSVV